MMRKAKAVLLNVTGLVGIDAYHAELVLRMVQVNLNIYIMKININFEVDGISFHFNIPIKEVGDSYECNHSDVELEEFDHAICLSFYKGDYFFEIFLCRDTLDASHLIVNKDNGFEYKIYEELSYTEFKVSIIY